jgi:hypothetical protein
LKFKLLGGDTANAGVQFRTKRIPNNHEVSGYQADMGAGWWGALYDESRRNQVLIGPDQEKMKQVVKPTEWNDYVIRAEGTHIQLWINGVQTVDYVENDPSIESRGVICPQIHAGPPGDLVQGYYDRRSDEMRMNLRSACANPPPQSSDPRRVQAEQWPSRRVVHADEASPRRTHPAHHPDLCHR